MYPREGLVQEARGQGHAKLSSAALKSGKGQLSLEEKMKKLRDSEGKARGYVNDCNLTIHTFMVHTAYCFSRSHTLV